MKFKPENHIIGKVYDLTQDNFNALISAYEAAREETSKLRNEHYSDFEKIVALKAQLEAEKKLGDEVLQEVKSKVGDEDYMNKHHSGKKIFEGIADEIAIIITRYQEARKKDK